MNTDNAPGVIAPTESQGPLPGVAAVTAGWGSGWPVRSPRDYPEDADDENGNYQNVCFACGEKFIGHKRRIFCKPCNLGAPASQTPNTKISRAEVERLTGELRAESELRSSFSNAIERDGKDIADLRAQLAAAQEDSKRLDWLEGQTAFFQIFRKEGKRFVQLVGETEPYQCETTRAAIDAARKEVKP